MSSSIVHIHNLHCHLEFFAILIENLESSGLFSIFVFIIHHVKPRIIFSTTFFNGLQNPPLMTGSLH